MNISNGTSNNIASGGALVGSPPVMPVFIDLVSIDEGELY
jgi:hypothetical protein